MTVKDAIELMEEQSKDCELRQKYTSIIKKYDNIDPSLLINLRKFAAFLINKYKIKKSATDAAAAVDEFWEIDRGLVDEARQFLLRDRMEYIKVDAWAAVNKEFFFRDIIESIPDIKPFRINRILLLLTANERLVPYIIDGESFYRVKE